MKSLFSLLKFRQKEIDLIKNENISLKKETNLIRKENKLLQDAVYPLTSSGIPLEKLAEVLKQIAGSVPKSEIEIKRTDASYHDSGTKLASNEGLCPDKTPSHEKTLDELFKDLLDSQNNIKVKPIREE